MAPTKQEDSNSQSVVRTSLTADAAQTRYTEENLEITVSEKHGPLYNAIPCMPIPLAVICCIFNILVPGLGTLISSFTVFCCGSSNLSRGRSFCLNMVSALLQMLTFIVIVGWIWSIIWGMTMVTLATSKGEGGRKKYYVRRQSSMPAE